MAGKKKTAAKKNSKKTVAKTGGNSALVSTEMQERMKGMQGAGIEKAEAGDFKIPMVYICQKGSAAYDKEAADYIKGIEVGDLYDTVNRRILPTGVRIIPCHFDVKAIEWVPVDKGGGLVKIHERGRLHDSDVTDNEKDKPSVNGNDLVETAEWLVLAEVEEGKWAQFMIPMSSSGLRASNTLCTMIAEFRPDWWGDTEGTPPSFLNTYRLGTQRKEKDGNAYNAYTVVPDEQTPGDVLSRAEALYALASTTNLEAEGRERESGGGSSGGRQQRQQRPPRDTGGGSKAAADDVL